MINFVDISFLSYFFLCGEKKYRNSLLLTELLKKEERKIIRIEVGKNELSTNNDAICLECKKREITVYICELTRKTSHY